MMYPVAPVPKPRMTKSDKWKKRPCVVAYFAYKDKLNAMGFECPMGAKIIFHMPMPNSWSKKKKDEHNGQPHQKRPDLDNLIKGVWDAIYKEDSHIWQVDAEKRWAYMPAIEVQS